MTLNDVTTYEDDFGNTKMLSIEDHSPKARFFSRTTKKELEEIRRNLKEERRSKTEYILSLDQPILKHLLNHYDHILLYDTEKEVLLWDKDKLNEVLKDDTTFHNICTFIEKIEEHVNNKG